MKNLLFALALASAFLFACGDDSTTVIGEGGEGGGSGDPADTGGDTAAETDAGTGDETSSGCDDRACTSSRDCGAGFVCQDGCCVENSGTPDAGGGGTTEPCGDVTFQGECQGDEAVWCQDGALQRINCATDFLPGIAGECRFFDDEFGYYCALPVDAACLVDLGDGSGPQPIFCAGDDPGCILTEDAAVCTENVGPCTPDSVPEGGACVGDVLALVCNVNQPVGYDCAAFGGTCADAGCVDLPEGAPCDTDDVLACGDGLECEGASDTAFGDCVAGEGGGEGSGGEGEGSGSEGEGSGSPGESSEDSGDM